MTRVDVAAWRPFTIGGPQGLLTGLDAGTVKGAKGLAEGTTPYIGASIRNNGVLGRVAVDDATHVMEGNCIALICNGQGAAGYSVYVPAGEFVASQDVRVGYNDRLNERTGLFLVTLLNRNRDVYGYGFVEKRTLRSMASETVLLPVDPANPDEPDWQYMEAFMAEEIGNAEGRLGLLLTDAEEEATIPTGGWGKFRVGDLFEGSSGDTDIQRKHLTGRGVPVVSAGKTNNGLVGMTDLPAKVFPAGTITVDMFGHVCYREHAYKLATHARVFSVALLAGAALGPGAGLFVTAVLRTLMADLFAYENMATWSRIKDLELLLPQLSDGAVDWQYMEDLGGAEIGRAEHRLDLLASTVPSSAAPGLPGPEGAAAVG